MAQVSTNELKPGLKVEVDGAPYNLISNEFVKPGKGQAFNRVKLKQIFTGRVIERTYKSGEKLELADVSDSEMRMLYRESDGVVFMCDSTFEQIKISNANIGENDKWLMEDKLYGILFYKGEPVAIEPPTFMDMRIVDTAPGDRGNTASGRVLKPAKTETGADVQVPIFIEVDELIKVDTRTGEYVSRSTT